MHGSAPWKNEETIVGLPRLLVLSVFSRSDSPDLVAVAFHLRKTALTPRSPFWLHRFRESASRRGVGRGCAESVGYCASPQSGHRQGLSPRRVDPYCRRRFPAA